MKSSVSLVAGLARVREIPASARSLATPATLKYHSDRPLGKESCLRLDSALDGLGHQTESRSADDSQEEHNRSLNQIGYERFLFRSRCGFTCLTILNADGINRVDKSTVQDDPLGGA